MVLGNSKKPEVVQMRPVHGYENWASALSLESQHLQQLNRRALKDFYHTDRQSYMYTHTHHALQTPLSRILLR